MKKMIIGLIVGIVSTLVIVFIILVGIAEGGFSFMAPGYNTMDNYLKKNIDVLSHVSDVLFELDYDSVDIRKVALSDEDKCNMVVVKRDLFEDGSSGINRETISVPDELLDPIDYLFNNGVSVISCGRDSVGFSMWSTMSESRGIQYSRTGGKPDGEQLIEVKQLSKENWYYYVHNFEKWKAQNPELFQ